METSEDSFVTILRSYQVSGHIEENKTLCNGCNKRLARGAEASPGGPRDKNVNKTDLQSYIYQTSNREALSRSYCVLI